MSTLKVLKEYLVGDDGYLLNEDNNGKTVMLSGAWGSGKTHFWLNDVRPQLDEKKQKNIYVSLYGRESIGELKFEVLKEAYNLEVKDDIISKSASMLSTIAPSLGEKSLVDGFNKLNKKAKEKKAEEILKSGSIICLDDFERKSLKIDLNDLFGYISQLAIDYKCKVVIMLNSDVFEGKEANVFKTVKEKTVNKFFYFEPTIEELFNSIYISDKKYKKLDEFKDEILHAIKETEELNARIYIQVLDNCLEWVSKGYNPTMLKVLILTTINYILNHFVLEYQEINFNISTRTGKYYVFSGTIYEKNKEVPDELKKYIDKKLFLFSGPITNESLKEDVWHQVYVSEDTYLIDQIVAEISRKDSDTKQHVYTQQAQKNISDWLVQHRRDLMALWKYGYRLYCMDQVDEATYNDIANFVKTGILLKKDREVQ